MNNVTVHPAKIVARFLLAGLAAAGAEFLVNAALSPFSPFKASADAAFWRLFIGKAIVVGNAMVFFISESRYSGAKLFALSLLAYVGVAQILGHAETVAFNFLFRFTFRQILFLILSQAATSLVFVPLVMAVAGKWKAREGDAEPRSAGRDPFPALAPADLVARLAVLGVLWYFCYMLAGYFIADPITHAYYAAKMENLAAINAWLPVLQFFRGIAWTLLVILGVRIMNRPIAESGFIVGVVYGVFHAAGLLLPNPYMPAEMRLSHLPEIVLSLAMFGGLAVAVLSYRGKRTAEAAR